MQNEVVTVFDNSLCCVHVLFDLDYLENCCSLEETVQITGSKA